MPISRNNVGRIAERIVANELEARGFRVSDLNTDGTAANADLLAVSPNSILQIQVKGSTNTMTGPWWVGYGNCDRAIIDKLANETVFNRRSSFYKATHVILVAVRSPSNYRCIILPTNLAEEAAQLNLDGYYRMPGANGLVRSPGKIWVELSARPNARPETIARSKKEREILAQHQDELGWKLLQEALSSAL